MFSRSMSSTPIAITLKASARERILASSFSRRAAVRIFESASPLMRRRGSRITAATTTGPASGPRPASSTPATRPSGSIMQNAEFVEDVVLVRAEHALVGAIQVEAFAALAHQRVGGEEVVLLHPGDIQDQAAGEADVERRIIVVARRLEVALEHVIGDEIRIADRIGNDFLQLAHRALERGLVIAEMK